MKQAILFLVALMAFCCLNATPNYILSIPVSPDKTVNLRGEVQKLVDSGLEIYYYNDFQIIGGSAKAEYPQSRLLGTANSGNLYLITKLDSQKDSAIPTTGKILLDLGTSLLLQSALNEVQLRQKIQNPFVPLQLKPMKLSQREFPAEIIAETRTDIQALVSQVNADSVMAFIQALQDFQTRYTLADNHLAVATWIKDQYLRFGITNAHLFSYDWQNTTQYDAVATIIGSVYPDIYIVVGGHHDSITYDNPLVFAPGADDNASGTVAAIEMARVMMATGFQPRCSIRFMSYSAEEFGLYGSQYYAQFAVDNNLNIRLMVNHDMISNNHLGNSFALLNPYDGSFDQALEAAGVISQYTDLTPFWGYLNSAGSDSYSFWQQGYPAIYFDEYDFSPNYHSNTDITANIDANFCAKIIRASTATTAIYANKPLTPTNLMVYDTGNGSSLRLNWDISPDPLVTYYKVYYGSTPTNLDAWVSTTDHQYQLSDLNEGQTYYVAVSAMDTSGNESVRTHGYGVPRSVPLVPVNFVDEPQFDAVQFSWLPNAELDLVSYCLYRSNSSDEIGSLIATIPAPQTSYTDANLAGTLQYYYYRLCAVDNLSNQSAWSDVVRTRPVSLDQGVLVIDETKNYGGSNPFQPTDEMVDNFYDEVLDGFSISGHLDLEAYAAPLRLADLGVYSAILWHGNDFAELGYPYTVREAISQYINLGGKVLFSLYQPTQAFELNAGYPVSFEPNSYINQVMGIEASDFGISTRFKYAVPAMAYFPALQVDSLKTTTAFNGHIIRVESIIPANAGDTVYTYGSDYTTSSPQGSLNGQSVGVLHNYGAGKVLVLSFPLYNMQLTSAKQLGYHVFANVFGQPNPVDEPIVPAINELNLLPNHPNPFSSETSIEIEAKNTISYLKADVYNLKGQMVKSLFYGYPNGRTTLNWDARDNQGNKVSSGIYFIRVQQNDKVVSRKLLLLK